MKYEYISRAVRKLKKKYGTGDVRELCGALKIVINPVPMGTGRTAVKLHTTLFFTAAADAIPFMTSRSTMTARKQKRRRIFLPRNC